MKEFRNQFLKLAERHTSRGSAHCQLVSPQTQKYETASFLPSLSSMNLAPISFDTTFFSLPTTSVKNVGKVSYFSLPLPLIQC